MAEKLETTTAASGPGLEPASSDHVSRLRQFLHDVATPLSAVALHLETASRRAAHGEDPTRSLEIARGELARAFELFERGRDQLLGHSSLPGAKA